MSNWFLYPTLYEINTWVWLSELSAKHRKTIDRGSVPPPEWDAIAALGFDAAWFMGVWERSPAGIAISNRNRQNLDDSLTSKSATPSRVPSPRHPIRHRVRSL